MKAALREPVVSEVVSRAPPGGGQGMDRPVRRPWLSRNRRTLAVLGTLLAVAAAWLLAPGTERVLRVDPQRIVVSPVVAGKFEDFIPVRAQVVPLKTLYLDAVEGGRVERVLVEDGTMVSAGDLLVELSNTALQLDVISREAQVTEQLNMMRTLELELERNRLQHDRELVDIEYQLTRLQRLVERRRVQASRGNIPRADLEDAEDELTYYRNRHRLTSSSRDTDLRLQGAQLEQLRATSGQLETNLTFARQNLEGLRVRAPVSGKLTALNAEPGQSLERGERLGQIDDPADFKLTAMIDEFYINRIIAGQAAELVEGGARYTPTVSKIYPQVSNGEFKVDLVFREQPPPGIRRGQGMQLRLFFGEDSDALMIPNGAFYQDTGGDWVFVVSSDGHEAVRRQVRLGRRNMQFIEVLDGLEAGEQVITSPYTNFLDMHRLDLAGAASSRNT